MTPTRRRLAALLCSLLLTSWLQACQPRVRYSQYYSPEQPAQVDLAPAGAASPLPLSVEPAIEAKEIRVAMSAARLRTPLPALVVPCELARLKTPRNTALPMAGHTYTSEYNPPRREIPYCTASTRPEPTPYSHHAYPDPGWRYDVVLSFKKPAHVERISTDSVTEALAAKTASALGRYDDWYEIQLPALQVDDGPQHFTVGPTTIRYRRKVTEDWRLQWFWPLVSKG